MKTIYTCGRMSGLSFKDQMQWRLEVESEVRYRTSQKVNFIHPPDFFNYEDNLHKTEREIFEWEISHVCNSDIVVVNLEGIKGSIGSNIEIGAVCGSRNNGGKHTYIVTLGDNKNVHPWLQECAIRNESKITDLAAYIASYLLV